MGKGFSLRRRVWPINQLFDNFKPHPAAEIGLKISVVDNKLWSVSPLQNINIKINSVTKSYLNQLCTNKFSYKKLQAEPALHLASVPITTLSANTTSAPFRILLGKNISGHTISHLI
uniref:Uncharacterized protein n=1 Tax=Ixodes ricinus TaxID=34613 RepID=A0A6B0UMK3_IXORI